MSEAFSFLLGVFQFQKRLWSLTRPICANSHDPLQILRRPPGSGAPPVSAAPSKYRRRYLNKAVLTSVLECPPVLGAFQFLRHPIQDSRRPLASQVHYMC